MNIFPSSSQWGGHKIGQTLVHENWASGEYIYLGTDSHMKAWNIHIDPSTRKSVAMLQKQTSFSINIICLSLGLVSQSEIVMGQYYQKMCRRGCLFSYPLSYRKNLNIGT